MATKLNFLQYTYRIRINNKTLYSQTFPGPHFGSWTISSIFMQCLLNSFNDNYLRRKHTPRIKNLFRAMMCWIVVWSKSILPPFIGCEWSSRKLENIIINLHNWSLQCSQKSESNMLKTPVSGLSYPIGGTHGKSGFDFKYVIFNFVLLIDIFRSYYDNALRWMSRELTDHKTTMVHVMTLRR